MISYEGALAPPRGPLTVVPARAARAMAVGVAAGLVGVGRSAGGVVRAGVPVGSG
ncbi:hypothetical protein GCM10010329_19550 [Streptomyces spiroverticillatus]|nr:hypothetical protein GCM10010329_19550 [Streptomyces spiroverticillatus]